MPVCRHCLESVRLYSRGLCRECYRQPGIRQRYPRVAPRDRHRGGNGARRNAGLQLPEPTAATPGTAGKVQVLTERASAGLCLWHPDDAPFPDVWEPAPEERDLPACLDGCPERLGPTQVAAVLGVSVSWVYRLLRHGRLPKPHRIPGRRRVFWLKRDVAALLPLS